MKSSAYSLDSLVVASYFPLTQCIEGLKVLVELLFGVTFCSIPLAPRESWHTNVLKMSLYHPEEVFASSLLAQSEKPVIGALYKSAEADSQKLSVAAKFKGQLFQLMQRLESTTPHFIHCIKPNNVQSPGMMTHQKFARRYGFLLLDNVASQDPLSVSVAILHQFNILPEMYQVGYTKLFFRTGQVRCTLSIDSAI
ncbi:Myosin-1 [Camellia lanceoleosa]|uniref:Myosin-1 n=1 Tax=Camellia lanceoleosa TaxID=1840588 RepID=A0ACC0ICP6_9ERIC|nr:Myosin-1 [Camellia lanceoleosa]